MWEVGYKCLFSPQLENSLVVCVYGGGCVSGHSWTCVLCLFVSLFCVTWSLIAILSGPQPLCASVWPHNEAGITVFLHLSLSARARRFLQVSWVSLHLCKSLILSLSIFPKGVLPPQEPSQRNKNIWRSLVCQWQERWKVLIQVNNSFKAAHMQPSLLPMNVCIVSPRCGSIYMKSFNVVSNMAAPGS